MERIKTLEELRRTSRNNRPMHEVAKQYRGYGPLIYLCAPYGGDLSEYRKRVGSYGRFALDQGFVPLTKRLSYAEYMNQREMELAAYNMELLMLGRIEELWVFGPRVTQEMAEAIERAQREHIVIRFFTQDLREEGERWS